MQPVAESVEQSEVMNWFWHYKNPLLAVLWEWISPPWCLWWWCSAVTSVGFGFKLPAAVTVTKSYRTACLINSAGGWCFVYGHSYIYIKLHKQHLEKKKIIACHLILNLKELRLQKRHFSEFPDKDSHYVFICFREACLSNKVQMMLIRHSLLCGFCAGPCVAGLWAGQGIISHCLSLQCCLCEINCFTISISFLWP